MSLSIFLSMLSFCFVLSISPGPVNAMIVTSGVNYGFKKTFSFISGATVGFTILLATVAITYEKFLLGNDKFLFVLELMGSSFIIYMGYKIASSTSFIETKKEKNKTLKFYEGFLLQWLNPKAWLACIAGVSMFVTSNKILVIFVVMYFIVCYFCLSFWGVLGAKTTRFFNTKLRLRFFNISMGTILILSALYLIFSKFI